MMPTTTPDWYGPWVDSLLVAMPVDKRSDRWRNRLSVIIETAAEGAQGLRYPSQADEDQRKDLTWRVLDAIHDLIAPRCSPLE